MPLSKRTGIAKKRAEKPEPATVICPAVETTPIPPRVFNRCSECRNEVYRREKCHHHYKLGEGFIFDEDKKIYVTKRKK